MLTIFVAIMVIGSVISTVVALSCAKSIGDELGAVKQIIEGYNK
jgi:hypothetical protein